MAVAAGTTYTPIAWMRGLLDALGSGVDPDNPDVRQCPAHEDVHPSLVLGEGREGQLLLCCRSGCTWPAILAALTLPGRYLTQPPQVDPAGYAKAFCRVTFPPVDSVPPVRNRSPKARGYRLASIHDYGMNHRVLRYRKGSSKEMFWETRRNGCWIPGLFGTPTTALPLYREAEIKKGMALEEPVLLVESESSVDALGRFYATTWAGGAGSPKIERLTRVLCGYPHLVVVPDNDVAGLACLAKLRATGLAPNVLMPDLGEDARDMYERLGSEAFTTAIKEALA